MLGFKSIPSARVILDGIEMVHMMCKPQAKYACNRQLSLVDQFERLAA
jgi:transposase-like protein